MKALIFYMQCFALLNTIFFSELKGQQNNMNSSFIYKYWFTAIGTGVYGITGTNEGGFAFTSGLAPLIMIDSTKYRVPNREEVLKFIEEADTMLNWTKKQPWTKDIPIYKCRIDGSIEWINKFYAGGVGCMIKQTKDKGFLCYARSLIVKLDSLGNTKWNINFEKDSIPGIRKTKFLTESGASDIYECKDGSFIALLNASFSLLKISKDGKAMWLKSTVFDEFETYVSVKYQREETIANYKKVYPLEMCDLIIDSTWYYVDHIGVYIPTFNVYETDDGGYMALGHNEYQCLENAKKIDTTKYKNTYTHCGTCKTKKNTNAYKEIPFKAAIEFDNTKYTKTFRDSLKKGYINETSCPGGTTVLVKNDKDGNVIWKKSFGAMSFDTQPHSDLIKLVNEKWLVHIRDCDSTGTYGDGSTIYENAHSVFYTLDNNGNTISSYSLPFFLCDPHNIALAADSGYYLMEQGTTTKTDKNFKIIWQKTGGDIYTFAATQDTGILIGGGGSILKFDKYGNYPSSDFEVNTTITGKGEVTFDIESNISGYLIIEKKVKKKNRWTQYYRFKANMPEEKEGKSFSYTELKLGDHNIIDLNKPETLNVLNINAFGLKRMEHKPSKLDIDFLGGFEYIKINTLSTGTYTYRFYSEDKDLATGTFSITDGY